MTTDITKTLNEREKTHGSYVDVAATAQTLKEVLRGTVNWSKMNDGQKEALEMICNKLGRLTSGDHNFEDHPVDIGGYSELYRRSSVTSLNSVEKGLREVISGTISEGKSFLLKDKG